MEWTKPEGDVDKYKVALLQGAVEMLEHVADPAPSPASELRSHHQHHQHAGGASPSESPIPDLSTKKN